MILEEIDGNVVCVIMRENGSATQLAVGDYFSDHESSSLTVTGKGKAIVRVDSNCTFEVPVGTTSSEQQVCAFKLVDWIAIFNLVPSTCVSKFLFFDLFTKGVKELYGKLSLLDGVRTGLRRG